MVVYPDASFLFSLYAQDANTPQASQIGRTLTTPLAWTPFQRHELRNAFRLAVFRQDMTAAQCRYLLETIEADLESGTLVETAVVWPDVYAQAEALSANHTEQLGTRAYDVLHVAAALALGVKGFFTFDTCQEALATAAGLKVRA